MRPALHPRLINKPFDDPGLFVSFLYEKRAFLFDLGEINSLSAKDILKITHVFVTHAHMDHFIGFDRLLRLCLGRPKTLYIYGPKGFLRNVEGKLAAYSWNLVEQYKTGFSLNVIEVQAEQILSREYRSKDRFVPQKEAKKSMFNGVLLKEPGLSVRAAILDHKIPCIGFALKEQFHVNIMKEQVLRLGLEPGPWLRKFKQALYDCNNPDIEIEVKAGEDCNEIRTFLLKDLKKKIARISPGQTIAYITDVGFRQSNLTKITKLAENVDHLFIEAVFLDDLESSAREKFHLTARQAGMIAGLVNAKKMTIFHFSPRYIGRANLLYAEAEKAYKEFRQQHLRG